MNDAINLAVVGVVLFLMLELIARCSVKSYVMRFIGIAIVLFFMWIGGA